MKNLSTTEQAVELLLGGGVGVMPTDTVYGLVARAADRKAVARLYELKRRERKPGTVIAASVEQLVELGVDARYLQRVAYLWPNAVSVIVPADSDLAYLHQDRGDFPVRIPKDDLVREMLEQTGPLLTSSANAPGEPTAENVAKARNYFGDRVDFYVDGGDLSGRPPSTIVKVSDGGFEVLRQGSVKVY
jgi:L-threonylcarbamoyladenylate synthase